jgi:hypothetical protein
VESKPNARHTPSYPEHTFLNGTSMINPPAWPLLHASSIQWSDKHATTFLFPCMWLLPNRRTVLVSTKQARTARRVFPGEYMLHVDSEHFPTLVRGNSDCIIALQTRHAENTSATIRSLRRDDRDTDTSNRLMGRRADVMKICHTADPRNSIEPPAPPPAPPHLSSSRIALKPPSITDFFRPLLHPLPDSSPAVTTGGS